MATPKGKRFASTLLPTSLSPLRFDVTPDETDAFGATITAAIEGAAKVLAAELKTDASISENFAGNYLRDHSLSKLTGGFGDTTLERLRNAVADAWDKGGTYQQVVDAIQGTMEDFSDVRAEMIAETETAAAYNAARSDFAEDWGADEWGWETESGDPCEDCLDNEGAGWIDINDDFPSGNDCPLHPRCMCLLNYRKTTESDFEPTR